MQMRALISKLNDRTKDIIQQNNLVISDETVAEENIRAIEDLQKELAALQVKYKSENAKVSPAELKPLVDLMRKRGNRVFKNGANIFACSDSSANSAYFAVCKEIISFLDMENDPWLLFFPTLKPENRKSQFSGSTLSSIPTTNVILTDDGEAFTEIAGVCVNYRKTGKLVVTSHSQQRELTPTEKERFLSHSTEVRECFEILSAKDKSEADKTAAIAGVKAVLRDSSHKGCSKYGVEGSKDLASKLFLTKEDLMKCLVRIEPAQWDNVLKSFELSSMEKLALDIAVVPDNEKECRALLFSQVDLYWKHRNLYGDHNTWDIPGYRQAVNLVKWAKGVPDKGLKHDAVLVFKAFLVSSFALDKFNDFVASLRADENSLPVLRVVIDGQDKKIELTSELMKALTEDKKLTDIFNRTTAFVAKRNMVIGEPTLVSTTNKLAANG